MGKLDHEGHSDMRLSGVFAFPHHVPSVQNKGFQESVKLCAIRCEPPNS